jgi:hypothetical protein
MYFQKLKKIDILVKDTAKMDSYLENQMILESKLSLNDITNNKNNTVLDDNSDSKNNALDKNIIPQNKRAMSFCWDCKKFPINMFCRDCCAFICKYCRMDLDNAHYSHRTITLYPENLAKSANLYKNVLIEDLNEVQKINKNAQKIDKENNSIKIDIDSYKTHLFEKVNRLLKKIKQIKSYQKEINYYINNKDKCKEKINKAIQDIKYISNEYNNNINNTNEDNTNKNTNNNNKKNIGDLKDVFTKMNKIEKNTQKICNIGKTIEEWEDINSKLEIALKTVENKIYSIITEAMNDVSEKMKDSIGDKGDNNVNNDTNENQKTEEKKENNNLGINENNNQDKNKNEENEQKIESVGNEANEQYAVTKKSKKSEDKKNTENIENKQAEEVKAEDTNSKEQNNENIGGTVPIKLNKDMGKEEKNENGGEEDYEYEEIEEEVEEEIEQ